MRIETAAYIPLEPPFMLADDVIRGLPDWVRAELIRYPRQLYVTVETHKTEVVEYLDRLFEIGESYRFRKNVRLEIDQSEIQHFSQFHVSMRALECRRDYHASVVRPTCMSDGCCEGSRLVLPLRIPAKKVKKIGIAQVHRPWGGGKPTVFVVAAWLRRLFEDEGIRGLEYKPCLIEGADSAGVPGIEPPYVAQMKDKVDSFADAVLKLQYLCQEHAILSSCRIVNPRMYREDFTESDFHIVDRLVGEGCAYRLTSPGFLISRRALQLLLKHNVRGLGLRTFYLKEKFVPEVLFERSSTDLSELKPSGGCLTNNRSPQRRRRQAHL